uniref:Uncharacterized protein n=1 Tax=Cacopsylla melanoneura TaxID=428564 RepID=A0A8D9E3X0_9HEMI
MEQNACTITSSSIQQTQKDILDKKKKLTAFMKHTNELATLIPIPKSKQVDKIPRSEQTNELSDIEFDVTIEKVATPVDDIPDPLVPSGSLGDSCSTIGDNEKESTNESSATDADDQTKLMEEYEKMVNIINLFNSKDLRTVSRSKQKSTTLTNAMQNFVTKREKNQDYRYGTRNYNHQKSYSALLSTPAQLSETRSIRDDSEMNKTVEKNAPNTRNTISPKDNTETVYPRSSRSSQATSSVVSSEASSSDDESPDTSDVSNDSASIVRVRRLNERDDSPEIDGNPNNLPNIPSRPPKCTDQSTGRTSKSTEQLASRTPKSTEQSTVRTPKSTERQRAQNS